MTNDVSKFRMWTNLALINDSDRQRESHLSLPFLFHCF